MPWLTKEIVNKIKKRNYYYRKSKRLEDFEKYKRLRNSVVSMLRQSKARFFEKLDPSEGKSFWKATKLFNISIKTGELPTDWKIKLALVTPIPKVVTNQILITTGLFPPYLYLANYSRSTFIYNCIMKHVDRQSPISEKQWGFTKGKATTGALLTAVESWHNHLDSGNDVCAVFFDFKKAFISVSHNLLLKKLTALGLNPYLLKWVASYLTQYIGVNVEASSYTRVLSGVPQRSVLHGSLIVYR